MDAQHSRDWPWAVVLLLLASVFGETIASASTPLLTYGTRPLTLPYLIAAYGCWALLLREAWARGHLSWGGAVLAGIGYTAFNEGLVARTWFKPGLDGFSAFRLGRVGGVNWCVVVGLCVFHTLFSMAMPIALVQIRRAERAPRPWVRRPGLFVASASVILAIAAGTFGNDAGWVRPDRFAAAGLAVTLPLLAIFILKPARDGHADFPVRGLQRAIRLRWAYVFGVGWAIAFYLSYYGLPALIGFPAIAGEAAVAAVGLGYLRSRPASKEWSPAHWVALIAGALTPALAFDAFQISTLEIIPVTAAVAALLRLSRRTAQPPAPAVNPPG